MLIRAKTKKELLNSIGRKHMTKKNYMWIIMDEMLQSKEKVWDKERVL